MTRAWRSSAAAAERFTFSFQTPRYGSLMSSTEEDDSWSLVSVHWVTAIASTKEQFVHRNPLLKKTQFTFIFQSKEHKWNSKWKWCINKKKKSLPDSPEILESMRALLRFMRGGKEPPSTDASISGRETGKSWSWTQATRQTVAKAALSSRRTFCPPNRYWFNYVW